MRTSTGLEAGSSPRVMDKGNQDASIPPITQHLPPKVVDVPKEVIKTFAHTKRVGNYLLGRTLGEGSFAKVKEGLHVLTGEKVAIKVVDKKRAKDDNYIRKNMRREGKLLQMVQHPNIVRLYEIMETENSYYLVTELCRGGDFMDYVCQKKRLEEREAKKYIRQVISAVDYLHRLGILHRDLKIENLLLDENRNIKLIDFGLSNNIRVSAMREGQKMQEFCVTQCGSPAYAAPELLGHKQYGPKVDAWSLGVNMYAMLTGSLPFTVDPFNIKTLHNKMLTGQMNPVPDYLTKDCRDFLWKLLTPDPDKRMSVGDAMKHTWLSEGKNKPMEPHPCPNRIRSEDINDNILHHMADFHGYRISDVIRNITSNIPGPPTAIYHLFKHRLDKYNGQQRVRGRIPAMDLRNKEHKLSLCLKDPAGKVTGRLPVTDNAQVTPSHPDRLRGRRYGRVMVPKEDMLEPKIIHLQIAPDVSQGVAGQGDHKKVSRTRPTIKLRRRDLKIEREKSKEQVKKPEGNDIVLVDVSPIDTARDIKEEPSPRTNKDEPKLQTKPASVLTHGSIPTGQLTPAKYRRTMLSELLPKEIHLRQRLSKQASHHQAVQDLRHTVDTNNNNNNNSNNNNRDTSENDINTQNSLASNCYNNSSKEGQDIPCKQTTKPSSQSAKKTMKNEVSAETDELIPNFRPLKSLPPSKSPSIQQPSSPIRRTVGIDLRQIDSKNLIDMGKAPYSRVHVSKSAGFTNTRGRLSKDLFDPKQILIEKCGGIVTNSKSKLRPNSPRTTTSLSPAKQDTFEMESLHPISPHSSTDSKSSRSTTNQSDQSRKSSNVALPSISISPTIMRTN